MAEDHPPINFALVLEFFIQKAIIFSVTPLPAIVCDDPDDDKFLACALASESRIIVSGDRHLLKVSGYEGIEVIKPREFLEKYLAEEV